MTGMKEMMIDKLSAAFQPQSLNVIDESDQHRGHGGWREGGETHFRVQMVTSAFSGKSRIDRHRMVNAALVEELKASVHALTMELKAPEEMPP